MGSAALKLSEAFELRHLAAPAKLNHFLHVTGRRANGYHEIESVFERIDWCDYLDIGLAQDGKIHFEMVNESGVAMAAELANLPATSNLVVRAAERLREQFSERTLPRQGARIRLFKHLPSGAGLGGGSSDAATALLGLNRLWGLNASHETLQALALPLGADLPFFLQEANAYVTGIGEEMQVLALPELFFVVIHPGISVPTAAIFTHPKLTRDTIPVRISGCLPRLTRSSENGSALVELPGRNDLESVACEQFTAVASSLELLKAACRESNLAASVRMTGSGACVFAAFAEQAQAQEAVDRVLTSASRTSGLSSNLVVKFCRSWSGRNVGNAGLTS
jgi:4-diphosphocytidyl-2-C-methyl-D-erythritol kinase